MSKKYHYRVFRGSSSSHITSALRVAYSHSRPTYDCYIFLGFRLVEEEAEEEPDETVNKADTSGRVIQGGGWCDTASNLRASYRLGIGPSSRRNALGFRLVEEMNDE